MTPKERVKSWRENNPGRVKEWLALNRERLSLYKKAYNEKNRAQARATARAWYKKNKKRVQAERRVRMSETDREKNRIRAAKWAKSNKERHNARNRARRRLFPTECSEAARRWALANPERVKANRLADFYKHHERRLRVSHIHKYKVKYGEHWKIFFEINETLKGVKNEQS